MESFQFLDNTWEGKMEPTSPASQDSSYAEEIIFEDYDFCNEDLFNNALFDIVIDTKPVITSDYVKEASAPKTVTLRNESVKKDQWLGEKLKLPQLAGGYAPVAPALVTIAPEIGPFSHQQQPLKVQNTEELLMEFDFVYDNVELTHLTPPQTPPQEAKHIGFGGQVYHQQQQHQPQQHQQQQLITSQISDSLPITVNGFYGFGAPMLLANQVQDIVHSEALQEVPGEYQLADSFGFQPVDAAENNARNLELEEIEEIVRSRSKDLPNCNDDDDDSCSFSEAGSVSSTSRISDSSSSYCGSSYSRDQDDEWMPLSGKKSSVGKASGGGISKKRTRPYGRGIEDKKSRKKEQNKNAATRYRQKKKAEIEEILIEERKLKDTYDELKSKSADIGREIRYLKSLMREVCKAKGLLWIGTEICMIRNT